MSTETMFTVCNALVLPGWLLLIFAPRWKRTANLIAAVILPAALAAVYTFLVVTHLGNSEGGFGSLADVNLLFQNPNILLAGWVHYLAFDLFIGSWEVRDSQRLRIHQLLVIPCLVLTFLLGPMGLLLYLALRAGLRRQLPVEA
jgi:hypothetical protein